MKTSAHQCLPLLLILQLCLPLFTQGASTRPASAPAAKKKIDYVSPGLPSHWDGGFYSPSPNVQRNPLSGVYGIWYHSRPEVLDQPFVSGGQVVGLWHEIHKAPGQYDFSAMDEAIEGLAGRKLAMTIEILGNQRPAWMFDKIPYFPRGNRTGFPYQMKDKQGELMYWHPAYMEAYLGLIKAFADHVRQSPHRALILGVRLNFNAAGTEPMFVPEFARSREGWIVPEGVEFGEIWKPEHNEIYEEKVVNEFINDFKGVTQVFIRATTQPQLEKKYREYFNSGELAWYYTGISNTAYWALVYDKFFLDCRSGKTLGMGEPFGDAWGNHGGRRSPRSIEAATANYWQVLQNLHVGLSVIACYGADLGVSYDGSLPALNQRDGKPSSAPSQPNPGRDETLKEEFTAAFEFAARYAGYHASPEVSPGAWIALRQTSKTDDRQNLNDVLNNDCTFLMKRLPDGSKGISNIGDKKSRYHGYARLLPAGEQMRLVLDPLFAKSLEGKSAVLKVIFFDEGEGEFSIHAFGEKRVITLGNSKHWRSETFTVEQARTEAEPQLIVESPRNNLTLHMLELQRQQDSQTTAP